VSLFHVRFSCAPRGPCSLGLTHDSGAGGIGGDLRAAAVTAAASLIARNPALGIRYIVEPVTRPLLAVARLRPPPPRPARAGTADDEVPCAMLGAKVLIGLTWSR
jgi:hypothetical protein